MRVDAPVKVKIRTRLKKFDGEVTPGKEPVEVLETEEREVDFDTLSPEMQREVMKRWE